MKCVFFLLVLAFVGFAFASTFVLKVETDSKSGKQYVEYEGEKYFLTDDVGAKETPILKKDCLIKINLSKADKSTERGGSVMCKGASIPDWDAYVKKEMAEFNATATNCSSTTITTTTKAPTT